MTSLCKPVQSDSTTNVAYQVASYRSKLLTDFITATKLAELVI